MVFPKLDILVEILSSTLACIFCRLISTADSRLDEDEGGKWAGLVSNLKVKS